MVFPRRLSPLVAQRKCLLGAFRPMGAACRNGHKFKNPPSFVRGLGGRTAQSFENSSHARRIASIQRRFCTRSQPAAQPQPPSVVEVDYEELLHMTPTALNLLKKAFVGPESFGMIAVINIPGYHDKLRKAFRAGIDLALLDSEGRERAAAVRNTYPGWSGTPGSETHPLQSSFLFNVKEEVPNGKIDPYFGKNIFPSEEYKRTWTELATPMHDAALQVLRGCDKLMESSVDTWDATDRSLHALASEGPALAGRFICYDSGFLREDKLLSKRNDTDQPAQPQPRAEAQPPTADSMASTTVKPAGHAGDGLASMRTHSTPIKSAGHAGDGLASMRTHSTPIKSAGHAGDGLASMRTHSTPIKSAGHAGDGLASMRTHSTPIKSAGHAGDGLASMRTHSTPIKSAGHAGDGLASMRTHSTPIKSAGHAGDGLASMRTHSTPIKSAGHAGDGLASMRTHSTPIKSAGHAGDGLASMRTHSTPIKSAGHAGDGLASMRTHSTPIKSAGHAGDGLASMRTHSTPIKSAGHAGDGLASMRTHSTPIKFTGHVKDKKSGTNLHPMQVPSSIKDMDGAISARAHSTQSMPQQNDEAYIAPPYGVESAASAAIQPKMDQPNTEGAPEDYWLPWHIDSNFITVLHKEMYAHERDASFAPEPEGAGLVAMNGLGDVAKVRTKDDAVLVQMGAFAQIYAGGNLTACRHAVLSPMPPGIARFNFCNFWYVPWTTVCDPPRGREHEAVNKGWNAMMDTSYLNITMKQSFGAFRQFMTSPEARMQFADTVRFKELSEMLPLPERASLQRTQADAAEQAAGQPLRTTPVAKIVIDVLTDVRCPFSFLSQLNLERALSKAGLDGQVHFRYHPVFLNPNVPKEGESLDDYLAREYGYSKEYAHSENYPLRVAGLELGVTLNPHRRVVNTFDAFCLVTMAQEVGKQHEVVKLLSRRYFEGAEDISDEGVLCDVAREAGLCAEAFRRELREAPLRGRVQTAYEELSAQIGEVPHFLLRERISGNGVEVGGNRSVEDWEAVLQTVLEKGRLMGMHIPGPGGEEVWLAEANPSSPVSLALAAQHGYMPESWPFTDRHFGRMDESPDTTMYSEPRFLNHLDEASIHRITDVYRAAFGAAPPGFAVLDLCSSWTSHFPQELLGGARVVVHGLNEAEIKANRQATEFHMQDLNHDAKLPWDDGSFDFVTMALSVQYLTNPRAVFSEMHRVLKPGGMALIAFSHRCFIEKAVQVWAEETYDGEGRAHIVCRYFQHGPQGGWEGLATVDASPRHGDPVWFVTATKAGQ